MQMYNSVNRAKQLLNERTIGQALTKRFFYDLKKKDIFEIFFSACRCQSFAVFFNNWLQFNRVKVRGTLHTIPSNKHKQWLIISLGLMDCFNSLCFEGPGKIMTL